jgi:hypothetical protein
MIIQLQVNYFLHYLTYVGVKILFKLFFNKNLILFKGYFIYFLDVFEDNFYFYESLTQRFYTLNKYTGNLSLLIDIDYPNVSNFQVFHDLKETVGVSRVKRSTGNCTKDYFLCKNNKCVHNSLLCNGYDNCGDDSDEERDTICKNFTCKGPNQYDCGMNYCIPNSKLCDLIEDCPNASDELLCKGIIKVFFDVKLSCYFLWIFILDTQCSINEFKCSYINQCVEMDSVCDGIKHCFDNSDESIGCIYKRKLNLGLAQK